ncbi:hypothetical protein JCM10212_002512 [Sporobolomyces blumeae]
MRIPLHVSRSLESQLAPSSTTPSASDPPLVFIEREPFLVEFQGYLELPAGDSADEDGSGAGGSGSGDDAARLRGSRVGKIDLSDPKKPTMRIAHHRLEGKLEKLLTPYALLRTTKRRRRRSDDDDDDAPGSEPGSKRARVEGAEQDATPSERGETRGDGSGESRRSERGEEDGRPEDDEGSSTEITIVGLVRHKIVFNKRPEPLIEAMSSEADPVAGKAKGDREAQRGPKGFFEGAGTTGKKR